MQIINVGEDMEKREPSHTVGGNVNCNRHCRKQYKVSLKKLKIELPYDPAVPLLSIYLKKTKTQYSKKYINPTVHNSIIYNCQDMEVTLCPMADEWIYI